MENFNGFKRIPKNEFVMRAYNYLETNKDMIMETYQLEERYNPTDLLKDLMLFMRRNRLRTMMYNDGEPFYLEPYFATGQDPLN